MIFTIANRLRGTYGWFAKVFGLVIFVVTYLVTRDWVVSLLFGGCELGEAIVGIEQDLVILALGVSYVMA